MIVVRSAGRSSGSDARRARRTPSSCTAAGRRSRPRWSAAGIEVTFVHGRRVTRGRRDRGRPRGAARGQRAALRGDRSAGRRPGRRRDRPPGDPRARARPRRLRRCRRGRRRSLDALADGRIPVVAPLAVGPLNVTPTRAAAALAVGLGAERILFLTDVPGVLRDEQVARPRSTPTRSRPASSRAGSCRSCRPRSSPPGAASAPRSARRW